MKLCALSFDIKPLIYHSFLSRIEFGINLRRLDVWWHLSMVFMVNYGRAMSVESGFYGRFSIISPFGSLNLTPYICKSIAFVYSLSCSLAYVTNELRSSFSLRLECIEMSANCVNFKRNSSVLCISSWRLEMNQKTQKLHKVWMHHVIMVISHLIIIAN